MILQRTSSLSCAATPLPQTFATGRFYHNSLRNSTSRTTSYVSFAPPFARRSSNHTLEYNNIGRLCTLYSIGRTDRRYSTNQRSDMAMTSVIASRSSPLRSPLARSGSWLQTSSPREAQPPRATAAPRLPAYRPSGVPLTSNGTRRTAGAPPRRAYPN